MFFAEIRMEEVEFSSVVGTFFGHQGDAGAEAVTGGVATNAGFAFGSAGSGRFGRIAAVGFDLRFSCHWGRRLLGGPCGAADLSSRCQARGFSGRKVPKTKI